MGITDVTHVIAYTSKSWYRHVARSTCHLPISIAEDFPDVPLLRQNDSYIMAAFIKAGYKNKDLYQPNIIRMFLKAVTIADIATADGRSISYDTYMVKNSNSLRDHYTYGLDLLQSNSG